MRTLLILPRHPLWPLPQVKSSPSSETARECCAPAAIATTFVPVHAKASLAGCSLMISMLLRELPGAMPTNEGLQAAWKGADGITLAKAQLSVLVAPGSPDTAGRSEEKRVIAAGRYLHYLLWKQHLSGYLQTAT